MNMLRKIVALLLKRVLGSEFTQNKVRNGNIEEKMDETNSNKVESIYSEPQKSGEIYSIWDFLEFIENTQAFHVIKVIGFDEWVTMNEIRRRIFDLFAINYKNERSLYAYIKTLVDCGMLETTNIGGKRKWRKKDLLIKLSKKKKQIKEAISLTAQEVK